MDKELSVLLIEDDPSECFAISKYIDSLDDILLSGVTNNSAKAIELVCELLPDAVILDLELHLGSGSGLAFLQELKQIELNKIPYILVTTNNTSSVTYEQVRYLGADFIMPKWQADYSAKTVVEFLRSIKDKLKSKKKSTRIPFELSTPESSDQISKKLEERITREMDLIGISPKAIGRDYIIEAIQILVKARMANITFVIAAKHGKTEPSVERAMQNAINKAWRTADTEDLKRLYTAHIPSERGVPTVTEFIYYYAQKVRTNS